MKRIEILIDEANPDKKIGISYNKVLYLQVCIGTMQTYQKQIIFDKRYKDIDSSDPFYDIIQILKSKEK